MKKVLYCLICLIGLSACSSENVVLDALKVYDLTNSACKVALSKTESRSDFYQEYDARPATLGIELGKDGTAQCKIENVKDNCAIRERFVNVTNHDNQITLIIYHNGNIDSWADCTCDYDVDFKMSKLSPGNYHLKVYYAGTDMKCMEEYVMYNGQISIEKNKKKSVKFNSGKSLPEC